MDKAIAAIEEQQGRVKARSAPWMVGEQLKDMIRREQGIGELIAQDLTAGGMTLTKAEDKIKDFADKHRTGAFACVTPAEAESILREYFGLRPYSPEYGAAPQAAPLEDSGETSSSKRDESSRFDNGGEKVIDLADFF